MTQKLIIKSKRTPPELTLTRGRIEGVGQNVRRKGFELSVQTLLAGQVTLQIPEVVDSDTALGQQLGRVIGKDLSAGVDLKEFEGKDVFVLLAPKRTSGGNFQHSVEAILAPDLVRKAAAELTSAAPLTTQTA